MKFNVGEQVILLDNPEDKNFVVGESQEYVDKDGNPLIQVSSILDGDIDCEISPRFITKAT